MTSLYETRTKHTKELLKHFVTLTYEIKNPNAGRHIAVFSLCWYLLAYVAREEIALFILFVLLGTLGIFFVIGRKHIGVAALKKQDISYQKNQEIVMTFGHRGFVVESFGEDEAKRLEYSEITALYKDRLFYFIGINNEEMQIITKDGITGESANFETFIEGKAGKSFYEVNLPFIQETKRRWVRFRYNFQMKNAEAREEQNAREAKIQEKKKNKKLNKQKKKK